MKKLYSLVAIAMFSVAAMAQTTLLSEDFASYTAGGNTATTGAGVAPDATDIYAGGTLPTGVPSANFPTGAKAYQAGGTVKLGASSAAGSMTSKTLDLSANGGNFSVTFDVKGWTTVEGTITVTVTGLAAQTATYTAKLADAFETKTLSFTGGTAGSTVTIATSAKRAFIDNVMISTGILAVSDLNSTKVNLVKNTSVKDALQFGAKANVQIVNMAGQIVRNASVNENTVLNVSSLAKGVYIVTAIVDGKKVSQKIIKD